MAVKFCRTPRNRWKMSPPRLCELLKEFAACKALQFPIGLLFESVEMTFLNFDVRLFIEKLNGR